ncbi:ABC transporter ATP-binding protein [Lactiplantibacillus herbarum]|uniref:ABC transporter ATP-binding protein n=1 Tax=Lactiplantibacillus herbarum TaxID=1670446 RepID=UPI00064F1B84|nr:ABC transporter ATP-binding protein [Lactiplantibacillus herbarum]
MLLTAKHLTKTYGHHVAVNGIDLQIEAGSLTAILGPNGAGKTTLIKMLIGQLTPSAGKITYQTTKQPGVVFQTSVLDAQLTVQENLSIRAKQYHHIPSGRIQELSKQLGLTKFLSQRYGTLSGGQKRRVDIARALLNQPEILFLDEPTTALDIQTRTAIWQLLHELQRTQHLTIILTTHYLDEADTADNVYVVAAGQVIANGTAAAIKQQYAQNRLILTSGQADPQKLASKARLVGQAVQAQANVVTCLVPDAETALQVLDDCRSLISNFEFHPGTMDEAFMALTGKELV